MPAISQTSLHAPSAVQGVANRHSEANGLPMVHLLRRLCGLIFQFSIGGFIHFRIVNHADGIGLSQRMPHGIASIGCHHRPRDIHFSGKRRGGSSLLVFGEERIAGQNVSLGVAFGGSLPPIVSTVFGGFGRFGCLGTGYGSGVCPCFLDRNLCPSVFIDSGLCPNVTLYVRSLRFFCRCDLPSRQMIVFCLQCVEAHLRRRCTLISVQVFAVAMQEQHCCAAHQQSHCRCRPSVSEPSARLWLAQRGCYPFFYLFPRQQGGRLSIVGQLLLQFFSPLFFHRGSIEWLYISIFRASRFLALCSWEAELSFLMPRSWAISW